MTLRTNPRVAGVTLIFYFVAGIASLVLSGRAHATDVRKTLPGIASVGTPQVSGAMK